MNEPGRIRGQQAEQGVRAGPRRREAFQKLPKRIEFQRRNGVFSDDGPEADRSASSTRTNRFHETPAIDGIAEAGVRFSDFYATSPVCSATRSSIQTGQYPARTGITDFIPGHVRPFEKLSVPEIDHHLRDGLATVGATLQSAGYPKSQ